MACNFCEGMMGHCPVCGETTKPVHESWEERLEERRHQGSHAQPYADDSDQHNYVQQGLHSINGGARFNGKYSRDWNSKYSGPGKSTN